MRNALSCAERGWRLCSGTDELKERLQQKLQTFREKRNAKERSETASQAKAWRDKRQQASKSQPQKRKRCYSARSVAVPTQTKVSSEQHDRSWYARALVLMNALGMLLSQRADALQGNQLCAEASRTFNEQTARRSRWK